MYSYDEAYEASLEYFDGDELAAKVFLDKYSLKDEEGTILESTPREMHVRLAKEFARVEKKKYKDTDIPVLTFDEIFGYFDRFTYIIPQGSPMYGIGNDYTIQSIGNCFTLGENPYDSYGGILYADQMLVQLCKRRCGVGISLDKIRPKGELTKNSAKTTDGIGVFMERFSNSTREVAQSGRRGALLEGLSVHHPEIETFINIKKDLTKVTGANISAAITDEFMDALISNSEYEQRWPVESKTPTISRMASAKSIWDQIIECAWKSAEPGLIFIDNARNFGTSHQYGVVDSRFKDIIPNPCGEIIMGLDSCRLMLLNLLSYVKNAYTKKASFDYELFHEHTVIAQRLMDDMVDLEIEKINGIIKKVKSDPEPEHIKAIELAMWKDYLETAKLGRRTGLGITALGDCLAALGITYGSLKSVRTTEEIYKALCLGSMESSCLMAKTLGAFPIYDKKIERGHPFMERVFEASSEIKKLHAKYGRRNISLTTTAPAGSVSILTQTTSGIEPVFMLEYLRRRKIRDKSIKADFVDELGDRWEENTVRHRGLQRWMDATGESGIENSPYHEATANEIDWKKSVKMQAVAQKWITHSISKTCNVPNDFTKEQVAEIYMEAYKSGCKGFTVYRDGSRSGVLVSTDTKKETKEVERPRKLLCDIHHHSVQGTPYFVLIGLSSMGNPYEVFAGRNGMLNPKEKVGLIERMERPKGYRLLIDDVVELQPITATCDDEQEAFTRMISVSLRGGVKVSAIVDQIEKVSGGMSSFAKGVARALKKYIPDGTKIDRACPECGSKALVREEGCQKCLSCGKSACN